MGGRVEGGLGEGCEGGVRRRVEREGLVGGVEGLEEG